MEKKFNKTQYDNEWKKKNSVAFSLRLFKGTDGDIIEFLELQSKQGKSKATTIKEALREKISRETYDMMDKVAEYSPDYKD